MNIIRSETTKHTVCTLGSFFLFYTMSMTKVDGIGQALKYT